MSNTDVLIAGAGPTGLTFACLLAERGVCFRIIDAAPAPPTGSRGKGVQPRSLELLDGLGVARQIITHGRFDVVVQRYEEDGRPATDGLHGHTPARPDAPYPRSLLTPQWRVEEALRGRLEALGGRVEYGVELTGFRQSETGVIASVIAGGERLPVETQWLVGCDGGKSAARQLAGIEFLGETLETHRMLVADVHTSGLDRDHWHMWRSAEGFLALCPLPSTDVFQLQGSVAPGQESETALETLQRMVERRTRRKDIRLSDPSWISLWRANVRMVDRYRSGRVFLAGDAAHVHSPAGGQGMNTGIQDAFNLGWKLAAVVGGADPALLDTYQEERLPVAAGVLKLSNALMASTVATGAIAIRRDDEISQLGLTYRGSSLARDMRADGDGLRAGDRAPEAPGLLGQDGACMVFDLLRGPHVTLLGFGGKWKPVIDACVARFGGRVTGHVIVGEAGGGGALVDQAGAARAAYGEDALFVVRPDHYIGLATVALDADVIISYLERLTS